MKRVSFYFGVEREGSLSRLYLGVEPQRSSDTYMTADLPRELCSGPAADDEAGEGGMEKKEQFLRLF